MMPSWLASREWTNVVEALLHTLWQGTIMAVMLGLALRRLTNPEVRYRCTLGALAGVVFMGLITWGILCQPLPRADKGGSPAPVPGTAASVPAVSSDLPPVVVNVPLVEPTKPAGAGWTAWLALLWVMGATAMLARAGFQVAGAERLRRSSRPLDDPRLAALLAEARQAVGLARRVRLAVTEKLTSPVVAGVLVPTLILPLSLITTLTPEQIRFILLHELAHIRRGDYFANLFQLFAEALLFFNPAVWWISRQMRIEREACCDARAVELSGAPADYARTLVRVVENALSPAPAAAPAMGDRREPSSLADRVQRMLVPGYRPALRLTWRAMFAALLTGGALLFLSALGTRVTIAAILSPQQRIERIEKKMAEYGENPAVVADSGNDENAPKVTVAGHIRMADGSAVPKWLTLNISSSQGNSSSSCAVMAKDGKFAYSIRAGTIYVGAETTNFAPVVIGPLDGMSTNRLENLELVFDRGFDVPLRVLDSNSGEALTNGTVATQFWQGIRGFQPRPLAADSGGAAVLEHCADLPLDVMVNVPGYPITQAHFDHLQAGKPLVMGLQRGKILSGKVVDSTTGQPIPGAELHLLYQGGADNPGRFNWDDPLHVLGTSGADGGFTLNQLQGGWRYYIGVTAPGHESVVLDPVATGTSGLVVRLGPELIVHGRVTGKLDGLQQVDGNRALTLESSEVYENNSWGDNRQLPLQVADGVATFEFTNRTAGSVTLSGGGYREARAITAPVADWTVNLDQAQTGQAAAVPTREVIFRFKDAGGVTPRGTVEVSIPDSLDPNHLTAHDQEMEITNGEVHVEIPVGGNTEIQPKRMVGYWFNQWTVGNGQFSIDVTNGAGPMVVDVPLIAAGAIYAKARNADGTPAGGLLFGVSELKRSPNRDGSSPLDSGSDGFSGDAPRKWVSRSLPLGGTYQIYAWRGNGFCAGKPIKLTEANPDAEVELQFPPAKMFQGTVLDADGKPLAYAEIKMSFVLAGDHNFDLKSVFTDGHGRFEVENATPDEGVYSLETDAPGLMAEWVKLNFNSQPQTIRLKRGHTLGGRLVEAGTGFAIPGAELRTWIAGFSLPTQSTHTDADGRFEFTTLGDGRYTFFADDGQQTSDRDYQANGNTNLVLKVKLYAWSKVKPRGPVDLQAAAKVEKLGEPEITTTSGRGENQAGVFPASTAAFSSPPASGEQDTNTLQVLITAEFYQMPAKTLKSLAAGLQSNPGSSESGEWWSGSPEEFSKLQGGLKASGLVPLSRPRVLTMSGREALMYIGDGTNGIKLHCLPVVSGGNVDLKISSEVVNTQATGMETNQFKADATVQSDGGLLVCAQNAGDPGGDSVVVAVTVKILTDRESAQFQQRLVRITKPAGTNESIHADGLEQRAMVFRLSDPKPESEMKQLLLDAGVQMPPTSFICTDAGMLLVHGTPDQLALVNRLALKLNGYPGPKNMGDGKAGQTTAGNATRPVPPYPAEESTNLLMRTFRVNTNFFIATLRRQDSSQTNESKSFKNVLSRLGVNWESPAGKSVFYNDRLGYLFVKATASDLDLIERTVEVLNQTPPQLHIKAWFFEVPKNTFVGYGNFFNSTNASDGAPMGILTSQNAKAARQALQARKDVEILGEPEITMLTGRRVQMEAIETIPVITNASIVADRPLEEQIKYVEVGAKLDAIPKVLADGYTINLPVIPSLTEFLGYDPKTNNPPGQEQLPTVLPKFQTQRLQADVNLWDGQTLVLGGFTNSDFSKQKVPILADVPLVGKLFRTTGREDKEVVIFITANIVDPAGSLVHRDEEMPFTQTGIPPQPITVSNDLAPLAVPVKSRASNAKPHDPQAEANQLKQDGKLLYESGKPDEAKAKFDAALKLNPTDAAVHYYLNLIQATHTGQEGSQGGVGRQAIISKMDQIVLPHVSFDRVRLGEVVRQLSEMAKQNDPEKVGVNISMDTNSVSDINSVVIQIPSLDDARLADVLDAVWLVADKPIKYSIGDDGVVFSATNPTNEAALSRRIFSLDPNNFYSGWDNVNDLNNVAVVGVVNAFSGAGGFPITDPSSGHDSSVRIQFLPQSPAQLHLKARFIEVPKGTLKDFGKYLTSTNLADGTITGILTSQNTKAALQTLRSRKGVETLAEPEITTLSGRRAKIMSMEMQTIVTNFIFAPPWTNSTPETSPLESGSVFDTSPVVLPDGHTINISGMVSETTFYGYANPKKVTPAYITNSAGKVPSPPIVLPAVEIRRGLTLANLYEGQTLVVSGLKPEQVRFAARDAERDAAVAKFIQQKDGGREMIVLITATIVDSTGARVHSDKDLPVAQNAIQPQPVMMDPIY